MYLEDYGWAIKNPYNYWDEDPSERFESWDQLPNCSVGYERIIILRNGRAVAGVNRGDVWVAKDGLPDGKRLRKSYRGGNFYQKTRKILRKWMEDQKCLPDWAGAE